MKVNCSASEHFVSQQESLNGLALLGIRVSIISSYLMTLCMSVGCQNPKLYVVISSCPNVTIDDIMVASSAAALLTVLQASFKSVCPTFYLAFNLKCCQIGKLHFPFKSRGCHNSCLIFDIVKNIKYDIKCCDIQ